MPEYRDVVKWVDRFDRAQTLSTTPGMNGWTLKDNSSAGAPTFSAVDGGGLKLTLASNSEEEVVTAYHGDVETFDIDDLQRVEFLAKVAGVDSVTTIVFGMADAQSDTEDSIATNVWFRMQGSASTTAVVVESDDGTTDYDDKATGVTLSSTLKKFVIDFTNGKADIRFFIDGVRVAATTTFTLNGYTGQLQPFIQLHKASGTGVPSITIRKVTIEYAPAYS